MKNKTKTIWILVYLSFLLIIISILVHADTSNILIQTDDSNSCRSDEDCDKGFCDKIINRCIDGLLFQTSLSNPYLDIGELGKISLSVSNPHNEDISVDITLTVGDGVELKQIEAGDQCGGSMCKLDRRIIPAGGKDDIIIYVEAISGANSVITTHLNYQIRERTIIEEESVNIIIHDCGNGIIEQGENSDTCCEDSLCQEDDFLYGYECNKNTHSCDKKLNHFIYLIFLLFLIIVMTPIIKHLFRRKEGRRKEGKEDDGGISTGLPWSKKEETQLKKEFSQGKSFNEMAKSHKRDFDAIIFRLIKLGVLGFKKPRHVTKKHGKPWSKREDFILKKEFSRNRNIFRLARKLKREPNAVLFRLVKLRRISHSQIRRIRRNH